MTKKAPVCIIVPTFNRAHFLGECLESLMNQTVPANQCIVVDDGSTDDTPLIARSFGTAVKYIRKENGGKANALNFALPRAEEEFVWIFDDDDVALPNAIESHLSAFERDPTAGFTYGSFIWAASDASTRIRPIRPNPMPMIEPEILLTRLLEGCFISLVATIVRRSCYARVGPFRPQLLRSEDYDMLLRLAVHFRGVYTGRPTLYVRQHSGARGGLLERHSASERDSKHLLYDRTIILTMRKSLPLCQYLPRNYEANSQDLCRATLQRACAMGRVGAWPEMLEDIVEFLRFLGDRTQLTQEEQRLCALTFAAPTALRYEPPRAEIWCGLRKAANTAGGRTVRLHLARGLWLCCVRQLKERRLLEAFAVIRCIFNLLSTVEILLLLALRIQILSARLQSIGR